MSSRLGSYLQSMKLSKQWEATARERALDKNLDGAIIAALNAIEYMRTANNNLASLAFEKRRKR